MPNPDDPMRPPSAEEIHRLAEEIASALGGTAHSLDDLPPAPVRPAGPEEWRLPDELSGVPLTKFTERGSAWARETPPAKEYLQELGLKPRDLTVYGAFPADQPFGLMVYRAKYPEPNRAVEAFRRLFQSPDTVWTTEQLGDIEVQRGTSTDSGSAGTIYLWADTAAVYQIVHPDKGAAAILAGSVIPFDGSADR